MTDFENDEIMIQIDLKFQGHHNENDLSLKVPRSLIKQHNQKEDSIMIKIVNDLKSWT